MTHISYMDTAAAAGISNSLQCRRGAEGRLLVGKQLRELVEQSRKLLQSDVPASRVCVQLG